MLYELAPRNKHIFVIAIMMNLQAFLAEVINKQPIYKHKRAERDMDTILCN